MTTGWDKFQEMIKAEMRKVYSEAYIEHSMNPRNIGGMDEANGFARVTGPCSDTMEMWLQIKDDRITDASFTTNGCGATFACGSVATEMAKGKTLGEALNITAKVILDSLGGLPDDHVHCAGLASLTLKKAIIEYMHRGTKPQKTYLNKQSKGKGQ